MIDKKSTKAFFKSYKYWNAVYVTLWNKVTKSMSLSSTLTGKLLLKLCLE